MAISTRRLLGRRNSPLPNHRVIVATGFRVIGLAAALASSLLAITMGIAACMAAPSANQHRPDYLSVTQYGLVGLLANAASGAGEIMSLFNGVAVAIFGLIAVLALIAASFGVLLYAVGRGLRASAPSTRFIAAAIMVVMLLNSLPALYLLQGGARLAGAVAPILSLYVLWVLSARYAE